MSLNTPIWGEGYVPAYQLSATPFVTSSNVTLGQTKEITFGSVTRFFTVKNTGASASVLAVGFTSRGLQSAQSNYFVLSGSESFSGELRVDRIFVSGSSGAPSFTVVAGLTPIPTKSFTAVTASNGFQGVG
jgi:hypothetical protein